MNESAQHPQYSKNKAHWLRQRDGIAGQREIKARTTDYLPKPDPLNKTDENTERYKQFMERAVYTNYAGRTHAGLVGAAFRKKATIELPAGIEYAIDNMDGSGEGLEQFARRCVSENIAVARGGLFVDFPRVQDGATLEDTQGVTARTLFYKAEDIINFSVSGSDTGDKLSMVVLREVYIDDETNVFTPTVGEQFRVLRLDADGRYYQYTIRDDGDRSDPVWPADSSGAVFDSIPFVFFGAVNNDAEIDKPVLSDLIDVNISHYQNSAELEESVHFLSQPTMVLGSQMSGEEFRSANPDGVRVGSRAGIFLGAGAFATLLQASPNNLAEQNMRRKEEQMVQIGARVIRQGGANETATSALIKAGTDNSVLSLCVSNVNAALIRALEYMAAFMGETGEIKLVLNQDFFDHTVDPQMLVAAMQMMDRGAFAVTDLIALGRKAGIIESSRTDDDVEGEAEITDPVADNGAAA